MLTPYLVPNQSYDDFRFPGRPIEYHVSLQRLHSIFRPNYQEDPASWKHKNYNLSSHSNYCASRLTITSGFSAAILKFSENGTWWDVGSRTNEKGTLENIGIALGILSLSGTEPEIRRE
jgi:hypothetical protein